MFQQNTVKRLFRFSPNQTALHNYPTFEPRKEKSIIFYFNYIFYFNIFDKNNFIQA